MDVSQQSQLTEQYIDHCRYEKRLDEKTIKAYKIDIQQFWGYLKEENGECSKEFLYCISHRGKKCVPTWAMSLS